MPFQIVKLTVLTKEGLCYSQQELYAALHLIPEMTEKDASPVGVLTADNRDSWSKAYTLLSQGQIYTFISQLNIYTIRICGH